MLTLKVRLILISTSSGDLKLQKAPKMRTYSRFSDKRPSAGTAVIPRARAGYRDIRGVVNLLLRGPEGKSHGEAA